MRNLNTDEVSILEIMKDKIPAKPILSHGQLANYAMLTIMDIMPIHERMVGNFQLVSSNRIANHFQAYQIKYL